MADSECGLTLVLAMDRCSDTRLGDILHGATEVCSDTVTIHFTARGDTAHGVTTACTAGVAAITIVSMEVTDIRHGLTAVR